MYITNNEVSKLADLVLDFEVAYRSFISDKIISRFITENDFTNYLTMLDHSISKSAIILSGYLSSKINLKNSKEIYKTLKMIKDKINNDHLEIDVMTVGTLVGVTMVLYNELFTDLGNKLGGNINFFNGSNTYHEVRNALAHRGSNNITLDDANDVMRFVEKISECIEDKYFWYVKKRDLSKRLSYVISESTGNIISINNLSEIVFPKSKVVCRSKLIAELENYIVGKESGLKSSASICIYGYGGVGKTSLVLEFVNVIIKKLRDIELPQNYNIDFLLYYTAKEESLEYNKLNGNLYIQNLRKQITSFADLKAGILKELAATNIEDVTNHGIIVIDNLETLPEYDKKQILEFIRFSSPRNIQYIITSRNPEATEDSIHISEFLPQEGLLFIDEYIKANNLNVLLNNAEKEELVSISKGNTLVLVLSLHRLNLNVSTIRNISDELDTTKYIIRNIDESLCVPQVNLEIIADFMYKNTFDEAYLTLKKLDVKVDNIIKVLSLYQEPIDLFTLSTLSEENISKVEKACDIMANKLILDKKGELYILNEFASKYITIRFVSNIREYNRLHDKILQTKSDIQEQLKNMEDKLSYSHLLRDIMQDWQVENYVDKISVSTIFNLYEEIKDELNNSPANIEQIYDSFISVMNDLEQKSQHPYLKYQRARIIRMFLKFTEEIHEKQLDDEVKRSYDNTIMCVEYYYPSIKYTNSYASVLWIYGEFLLFELKQYEDSAAMLEKSQQIFEKINSESDSYSKCILALATAYMKLYDTTNDYNYLSDARYLINSQRFGSATIRRRNWVHYELSKRR
jgi:hypothetical protein